MNTRSNSREAAEFKKRWITLKEQKGSFLAEFVNHVDEIKVSIDNLAADSALLKQDVASLRQDVSTIKNEIQTFKEDMRKLIRDEFSIIIKTEVENEVKNASA